VSRHGKTYRNARGEIDRERVYSPAEAVRLVKALPGPKFDETVEVHFSLGLNVRHAEQQLRGTISLPHGTGREQRQVGRLGRILGPRGLMPNPRTGTVTMDVGRAVREAKAGKQEYRTDRGANVHVSLGKKSFEERSLLENYAALIDEIVRAKPAAAKGRYIRQVTLATTMGPGIKVDPARTRGIVEEESAEAVEAESATVPA
jgi:large subunit ribosomal protein L1